MRPEFSRKLRVPKVLMIVDAMGMLCSVFEVSLT